MSSANVTTLPGATSSQFVLGESVEMPEGTPICVGYDFNKGVSISGIMEAMLSTGFQATNLGKAVVEIRRMRKWRLSDVPIKVRDSFFFCLTVS